MAVSFCSLAENDWRRGGSLLLRAALDSKDLQTLGKTDATAPLVVGRDVYDPLTFIPKICRFSRKQYQFLNHYRLGVPFDEACSKAGLNPDSAERFLQKPSTIEWLQDRALMQHIKTEWEEPAKWWNLGNEVLEGKREFNKAQTVVFQEFGARICPKKTPEGERGTTKIEINIDPTSVRNALIRQEAIDGETL